MKKLEIELAKKFARIRKDYTGSGPIDTQVRICADTLLIRYRVSYTYLEKWLITQLKAADVGHQFSEYDECLINQINEVMFTMFPDDQITVLEIFNHIVVEEEQFSYWLIRLNRNLEKSVKDRAACI